MSQLFGVKVAAIATNGFEESELFEPVQALRKEGGSVVVVAPRMGQIQGFKHQSKGKAMFVDRVLSDIHPDDFDALLLPGGTSNADALRVIPGLKSFIRRFDGAGKPIAAICHAPWILISARVVKGRHLTSDHSIQDDIRNAGGHWSDEEVVVDRNWVTSRQPADLPAFNREMIEMFSSAVSVHAG